MADRGWMLDLNSKVLEIAIQRNLMPALGGRGWCWGGVHMAVAAPIPDGRDVFGRWHCDRNWSDTPPGSRRHAYS
jgi:hypothetical protein